MSLATLQFEAGVLALMGAGAVLWALILAKPRMRRNGLEEPRRTYLARRALFVYCGAVVIAVSTVLALFPSGLLPADTSVKLVFGLGGSMFIVSIGAIIIFPGIAGKGW